MNFKDREYILFDLDGTITESGMGIINGIKHSMKKMGMSDLCKDEEVLATFIGPPLKWSYMDKFGMDSDTADSAIEHFRKYYEVQGALYENRLYSGIKELFEALISAGKKIVLATSKPEETAVPVIRYFELEKYFFFIGAANLELNRMEKEEVIAYILENCQGITTDNAVMVGDRVYDVEGARKNNMDCIAVAYGYAEKGELEKAKPAIIADSMDKLKAILLG